MTTDRKEEVKLNKQSRPRNKVNLRKEKRTEKQMLSGSFRLCITTYHFQSACIKHITKCPDAWKELPHFSCAHSYDRRDQAFFLLSSYS